MYQQEVELKRLFPTVDAALISELFADSHYNFKQTAITLSSLVLQVIPFTSQFVLLGERSNLQRSKKQSQRIHFHSTLLFWTFRCTYSPFFRQQVQNPCSQRFSQSLQSSSDVLWSARVGRRFQKIQSCGNIMLKPNVSSGAKQRWKNCPTKRYHGSLGCALNFTGLTHTRYVHTLNWLFATMNCFIN